MLWRLFGFLFTAGMFLFLVGVAGAAYLIWTTSQELPDYEVLASYEPPVMTRVHAADGALLAEFARERRLFVPVEVIPERVVSAFVAAEDKNFFDHSGVDVQGIMRAVVINAQNMLGGGGRRLVGASTITQQVAKNFLLTSEQTYTRKLKEALLALKIERTFDKNTILELYLNEIYLGLGSYGVAAASMNYYGKSLHELSLAEVAYLAALPKAPNNYHPFRHRDRAIERRNYVIDRMAEDGFVTAEEAATAKAQPLEVSPRPFGAQIFAAEYFAEEVRRASMAVFGEKKVYEGGLSIRTTLDPEMQRIAKTALVDGLVAYDRRHGWRGPVTRLPLNVPDWGPALAEIETPSDIAPWRLAVALEVQPNRVVAGLKPRRASARALEDVRETIEIAFDDLKWARPAQPDGSVGPEIKSADQVLAAGDVIYVAPKRDGSAWQLMQLPKVEGAIVAIDPHTGRVHAMVGGFSYDRSEFNRAAQALRQPGSAFKPFVYAAALDRGFTPASIVMDAPLAVDQGNDLGYWRPQNYGRKYYGPSTLRLGIEKSRNVMTVRLAQDVGMDTVAEYGARFGIYERLPPVLSMSLGAGETSLLRLTAAYGMLANGGRRISATLIDRIQDRYGRTIFRHDQRDCPDCVAAEWTGQAEPALPDDRLQILDPHTAYQITSMMEGVVERGTATVIKEVGKPLAGKTGTTNEERDAWFIGYSPDLVVGVFVGFDTPRPMGRGETGGGLAAPVFKDFMKSALAETTAIPFRVPAGINLVRINAKTGVLALPGDEDVIIEAFKPGSNPPDNPMDVIEDRAVQTQLPAVGGPADAIGALLQSPSVSTFDNATAGLPSAQPADEALTSGTGGLY